MGEPIRILEVVNVMDRAGLETFLMNHYRHFDRDVIQMDFLTHRPIEGAYDDEIKKLGGKIFHAPRLYPHHWISYRKWMNDFFTNNYYPVVHSHIDAMSYFPLTMARSNRVTVRVAHSHSNSVDHDLKYPIKEICRKRLPMVATHYWACSEEAGVFLFGKNNRNRINIVRNAVDLAAFSFDLDVRQEMRKKLNVDERTLVIGHVGRFSEVKNQSFILRILEELCSRGVSAEVVFVGEGELMERVKKEAAEASLSDHVHFLGLRDDVNRLIQAFDIMCFPSLHEGIPVSLIEAQASGLPILASDKVSREVFVLSNCDRLPLDAAISDWAFKILSLAGMDRPLDAGHLLTDAGYEICSSARELMGEYLALWETAKKGTQS